MRQGKQNWHPESVWTLDPLLGCSNPCEVLGSLGIVLVSVSTDTGLHSMSGIIRKSDCLPVISFLQAFHCTQRLSVARVVLMLMLKADVWLNNSGVVLPILAEPCWFTEGENLTSGYLNKEDQLPFECLDSQSLADLATGDSCYHSLFCSLISRGSCLYHSGARTGKELLCPWSCFSLRFTWLLSEGTQSSLF